MAAPANRRSSSMTTCCRAMLSSISMPRPRLRSITSPPPAADILPGFGHRFHPVDLRAAPLLALVDAAAGDGHISGHYVGAARAIERVMQRRKGKLIPMNIDGASAVIYGELGFAAPLARGIFACRARSASSRTPGSRSAAGIATRARCRKPSPINTRGCPSAPCRNRTQRPHCSRQSRCLP